MRAARRSAEARRLDDGTADFCFDPSSIAATAQPWSWQAWNVPDMPWDRAPRCTVDLASSRRDPRRVAPGRRGAAAAVAARRPPRRSRDDTGLAERVGSTTRRWSTSRSSTPARRGVWASDRSPSRPTDGGSRSPATRRGFGRLCVVDVADGRRARRRPRRARSAVVGGRAPGRAAHRARGRRPRSSSTTPTTWARDGRSPSGRSAAGRTSTSSSRSSSRSTGARRRDGARPPVPRRRRADRRCCAGCTAGRPTSGR